MRNCFIPKCDAKNKSNPSRTMFNVPTKDPLLFRQWEEILPKHRQLKKFDRICVNHFREEDIVRYWEHRINGQIELIPRDKPALRPNAVPFYNREYIQLENVASGSSLKKYRRRTPGKANEADTINSPQTNDSTEKRETGVVETMIHKIDETIEGCRVEHNIIIEVLAHPDFETLYDEVYEVELPSTLWGIHRDLDKTFIAFTEFNKDSMNIRKYLYVDQCLQYRMAVGQRIMKTGMLATASTEAISGLLAQLDGVKVRKVIIKGSSTVLNEC